MTLEELGYSEKLENYRKEQQLDSFGVGRVISEHRERYVVNNGDQDFEGEIIGNLRFSAQNRSDFPAVGDWVAISEYDEGKVLIHAVLPRKTTIERQAVGKVGEKQIIATNVDYAFIVQAVDRDFNVNRIERYLAICHTSGVTPLVVLNKIDLVDAAGLEELRSEVRERLPQVPLICISNESREGIEDLMKWLSPGKSSCLLGSSGVGKSTLINTLAGKEAMDTDAISISTGKGRHVTTHRELHVLDKGGILIDNPGMREVGIADSEDGLEMAFDEIARLSKDCRYADCRHVNESGCAVIAALERGEIDGSSYENYQKMEREKEHFESTVAERRQKDKDFGKMVKEFKKKKNSGRY